MRGYRGEHVGCWVDEVTQKKSRHTQEASHARRGEK